MASEQTTHKLIGDVSKVLDSLVRWGCGFLIVWVLADPLGEAIQAFAGKDTNTQIKLEANINNSNAGKDINWLILSAGGLGWVVGAIGIVLAIKERKLRFRYIEDYSPLIKRYELESNPNRTSSGLAVTGETNPKDA